MWNFASVGQVPSAKKSSENVDNDNNNSSDNKFTFASFIKYQFYFTNVNIKTPIVEKYVQPVLLILQSCIRTIQIKLCRLFTSNTAWIDQGLKHHPDAHKCMN